MYVKLIVHMSLSQTNFVTALRPTTASQGMLKKYCGLMMKVAKANKAPNDAAYLSAFSAGYTHV